MVNDEKQLEKLNRKLNKFLANPRIRNFDAFIDEMERLQPGSNVREVAERIKKQRGLS